ncbi:MAG: hypothetical protein JXA42_01420 [Anaerolineales bacterium]|nr:hypothetical protein [Anaerolineales bacterium]
MFYIGHDRRQQIRVKDRAFPGNFAGQLESFANSILQDTEPEVTGLDGLKTLEAVLAVY